MIVPTVERGLRLVDFWSIETAGTQALDEVDVRPVDLAEELARVGGQRFDIAALALGEDRVERERRLAGAGEARENDERITRDFEVDVLQIVNAGTPDTELCGAGDG